MTEYNLTQATLCMLVRGSPVREVLLGYKKTGFGQGKYSGFGGKVENGESIEHAALREMEEETGVRIAAPDLRFVAKLTFLFPDKPDWNQEVYTYLAETWQGEPAESNEMIPAWFATEKIPYAKMWDDSSYWLPPILAGKRIQARFVFFSDNETVHQAEMIDYPEPEN